MLLLMYFIFQAKQVFEKICPEEEFLPKAPNPEDIIYDDSETGDEKETGFESEAGTATTVIGDMETTGDASHSVSGAADTVDGQDDLAVTDNNSTTTERDKTED